MGLLIAFSAQTDTVDSRDKLEKMAAPLIEAALKTPVPDLYAAAGKGDNTADLIFGLALLADRRMPYASQNLGDVEGLAALEERVQSTQENWLSSHKHKSPDDIDWSKALSLNQSEIDMLNRIQMTYSANYWLSRSLVPVGDSSAGLLSGSAGGRTCYTCGSGVWSPGAGFVTNFGAKSYTSEPVIWQNGKITDEGLAMTAIHCVEAVREKTGLPADVFLFYRLKFGQLPIISQYTAISRVIYELQNPSPHLSYSVGASACGEQMQEYLDIRREEPLESSAIRLRFGITG